jgi:photosystem II stability/assembly factor-like uncharacterized protein
MRLILQLILSQRVKSWLARPFYKLLAVVSVAILCSGCATFAQNLGFNPWQIVSIPTEETLLDMNFIDPQHGWMVGSNNSILETGDGGQTWTSRNLALDDDTNYRLSSVSFSGNEGWITGQPSILLHTTDAGSSWSRIPLSSKLPGAPNTVFALGSQAAEMTTDLGAIYATSDGGRTWKALVQEAFGVVRNISRSPEGKYVAVSSNGSFYSTWEPGQESWEPHNRNSSRRVQNMGFGPGGQLWMLANGGQLQFNDPADPETWGKAMNPQLAVSVGLLDLSYRTPTEAWISGGSGNLLCSLDGGQTWQKDDALETVPSNLYRVIFVSPEQGFIIGQKGTLLRYTGDTSGAATGEIPAA